MLDFFNLFLAREFMTKNIIFIGYWSTVHLHFTTLELIIRCEIFINFHCSSLNFEVKKSEVYYSEPHSKTSKNGHKFR